MKVELGATKQCKSAEHRSVVIAKRTLLHVEHSVQSNSLSYCLFSVWNWSESLVSASNLRESTMLL